MFSRSAKNEYGRGYADARVLLKGVTLYDDC